MSCPCGISYDKCPLRRGDRVQSVLPSVDVQFEPIRHFELVIDAAEMVAHGVLADAQLLGETSIVGTRVAQDVRDDLALARRERRALALVAVHGRGGSRLGKLRENARDRTTVEP